MLRRDFLKWAAMAPSSIAALSALAENSLQADNEDSSVNTASVQIVDTHHHLWDLEQLRLPWLEEKEDHPLRRSFVMKDYAAAVRDLNVVKTVYMEVNVHPSQQVKEAEFVLDLCKRDDNPMVAAVIGGSPAEASFKEYIERFAENQYLRGVRTVLHDPDRPEGLCLRPQFVSNIKLLGELGLRFDLCMRPGEILDGVRLAERCPKTRFIIDHCGNMPVGSTDEKLIAKWKEGINAAAGLDNVVCKISGIVVTANEKWTADDLAPNMNFCMETFGDDRVFFGGDWPVCTLRSTFAQWVNALKKIVRDRPAGFRKKLFHDNAVAFYELA